MTIKILQPNDASFCLSSSSQQDDSQQNDVSDVLMEDVGDNFTDKDSN